MISTTTVKHIYIGDGINRYWAYTFPITSSSDIAVYLVTIATEAAVLISSNYSVDTQNSRVIYPTVASGLPLVSNLYKIVVISERPETQLTDLSSQGTLGVAALEAAVDKLTILVQQLDERVTRSLKFGVDSTSVDPVPTVNYSSGITYFGDPSVDGSWKLYIKNGEFTFAVRTGGVWVDKGSVTP